MITADATRIARIHNPSNNRIHPTQKVIKLYDYILLNYAQKGVKILDTHVGSGSSRIACFKNGFDFVGFEINKEFFEARDFVISENAGYGYEKLYYETKYID